MRIVLTDKDSILIEPETDFESQWLSRLGHDEERDLMAFHKSGLSTGDYIGIKIQPKKKQGA